MKRFFLLILSISLIYSCSKNSDSTSPNNITTKPDAPALKSPGNTSAGQSTSPTMTWNASDGAASYSLQLSQNNSFSSFVYNQSGISNTSQLVSGLSNSTTYYWRVSATNSYGTSSYSEAWLFITEAAANTSPCPGLPTVTYAGKTYNTIQIDAQCWLKENLDVGTMIPGNQNAVNNGTIEKHCYNNDPANCASYGGLYQWNEAMSYSTAPGAKGICPEGFHVPRFSDLQILATADQTNHGNALKAVGQGSGNGAGTNSSGFSALLAGNRDKYNNFINLGISTLMWSSTEYYAGVAANNVLDGNSNVATFGNSDETWSLSVRCIKD